MWNDILTIVISVVSVTVDIIFVILLIHFYRANKRKINVNNEHIRLIKMTRGDITETELAPFCENLTDIERQIIMLYFVGNMKLESIAIELHLSLDYVKKVKAIAMSKMKKEI